MKAQGSNPARMVFRQCDCPLHIGWRLEPQVAHHLTHSSEIKNIVDLHNASIYEDGCVTADTRPPLPQVN
jgi:hypothetical protein